MFFQSFLRTSPLTLLQRRIASLPRFSTACLLAGLLLCGGALFPKPSLATELPLGVVEQMRHLDPNLEIRFDGLITLTDGTQYVPILPQQLHSPTASSSSASANNTRITAQVPGGVPRPDLIAFNNQMYLLRLVPTASGKWTLPRLPNYPVALKEGMLPQDFVLPSRLSIPAELKILLGALPYKPDELTNDPTTALSAIEVRRLPPNHRLFFADPAGQRLLVLDPEGNKILGSVLLGCLPSRMTSDTRDGQIWVSCLNTDTVVQVDAASLLVKARYRVAPRPSEVLLVAAQKTPKPLKLPTLAEVDPKKPKPIFAPKTPVTPPVVLRDVPKALLVSHRHSPALTRIRPEDVHRNQSLLLPGPGGVMTPFPSQPAVFIADSSAPKVYLLDLPSETVARILPGIPNISALCVTDPVSATSPAPGDKNTGSAEALPENIIQALVMDAPALLAPQDGKVAAPASKSGKPSHQATDSEVIQAEGPAPHGPILWMTSRNTLHDTQQPDGPAYSQLVALDLQSGRVLKTYRVGPKPTAMMRVGDRLWVLSSAGGQLDSVQWQTLAQDDPVVLEADAFPTAMALLGDTLFLTAAGNNRIFRVDTATRQFTGATTLPNRATAIAVAGPPRPKKTTAQAGVKSGGTDPQAVYTLLYTEITNSLKQDKRPTGSFGNQKGAAARLRTDNPPGWGAQFYRWLFPPGPGSTRQTP